MILSEPNGYIDLSNILKCNKVKDKKWTLDEIKAGIESSDKIELDLTGEKVRRKNNLDLPPLKFLTKKRKKEQKNSKKDDDDEEKENVEKKEATILKITCKEKTDLNWKSIFEEFKKLNPDLDIIYGRFKDTEGHLSLILKKDQSYENLNLKNKFKVQGTEFTVEKCEGDDLISFWKEHGSHYEFCTNRREKINKSKEKRKENKMKYLPKAFKLGERKIL